MSTVKEFSVEEKLSSLVKLQKIESKMDEIQVLKGELPMEVRDLEDEIQGLVRAKRGYLAQLRAMVERQLVEIETAEATPAPQMPTQTQGSSPSPRRDEPKQTAHPTPAWLDSLVKE